jgi:hypothetical protein
VVRDMLQIERHPQNKTINRIVIENRHMTFDIELRGFITAIEGDSSTGKTFLFNNIRVEYSTLADTGKRQTRISEVILINDVLASDKTIMGSIKDRKGALILFDNASTTLAGRNNVIEYILKDRKNQYVLAMRGGLGIQPNLNFVCELYEERSGGNPRVFNKFVMTKPTRK